MTLNNILPRLEICFREKIDELFQELPNVFGTGDDVLIAGFSDMGRDHDASFNNLKFNKDKYLFRCASMPFFSDEIL